MFTDYTFTIISTISELNEIADGMNNGRIKWDRLESKLMIAQEKSAIVSRMKKWVSAWKQNTLV